MGALHAHARFDDLDLDARSQWVRKGKTKISVACSSQVFYFISETPGGYMKD